MKRIITGLAVAGFVMSGALPASAHVVVKPSEVGAAAYETFTMSVPNEKGDDTVALRLVIPDGLKSVSPTVKPGWKIETKRSADGEGAPITEIDWSAGTVPAGERDDFTFSAQAPAAAGELHWKAYQTYADGTTVSWDQTPDGTDNEELTAYSVTKVTTDMPPTTTSNDQATEALYISGLAILIALGALGTAFRSKRK